MRSEERRAFVEKQRTCEFGFERKMGPPGIVEDMAKREATPYWSPVRPDAGDGGSDRKHGCGKRLPWREN